MPDKRFEREEDSDYIRDNLTNKRELYAVEFLDVMNDLVEEINKLKHELQRMYDVTTINKSINILERYYDELLSNGSDELKDAMRHTVLKCIDELEEFKDEI